MSILRKLIRQSMISSWWTYLGVNHFGSWDINNQKYLKKKTETILLTLLWVRVILKSHFMTEQTKLWELRYWHRGCTRFDEINHLEKNHRNWWVVGTREKKSEPKVVGMLILHPLKFPNVCGRGIKRDTLLYHRGRCRAVL